MIRPSTFGFELELAGNTDLVVANLTRQRWLTDSRLHNYHCPCDACRNWQLPLRAQTDSSVQGELISGVFGINPAEDADATVLISGRFPGLVTAIESACAEEDGRISERCGLHVHVRVQDDIPPISRTIRTYCAAEEHLVRMLAPGRFHAKRAMNHTIMEGVRIWHRDQNYRGLSVSWGRPAAIVHAAIAYDRHIDLNLDTARTRTAEYRLWNSTMMAWRIELACRLSVWLANNQLDYPDLGDVMESMLNDTENLLPSPISWDDFVAAVAEDDTVCADLMTQQAAYMREIS